MVLRGRGGGVEFNRMEGKEINDLAQAAERFVFLNSAVCSSEAASLCPQASSVSLCSWTWTRHSSSAASCFTSGFVCIIPAREEVTDGGGWAPLDVGISAHSSLPDRKHARGRAPIPPFSLFAWPFPGCLGGPEQGGGFLSHDCLLRHLLGADVYFVAASVGLQQGWLRERGGPRSCWELVGSCSSSLWRPEPGRRRRRRTGIPRVGAAGVRRVTDVPLSLLCSRHFPLQC